MPAITIGPLWAGDLKVGGGEDLGGLARWEVVGLGELLLLWLLLAEMAGCGGNWDGLGGSSRWGHHQHSAWWLLAGVTRVQHGHVGVAAHKWLLLLLLIGGGNGLVVHFFSQLYLTHKECRPREFGVEMRQGGRMPRGDGCGGFCTIHTQGEKVVSSL